MNAPLAIRRYLDVAKAPRTQDAIDTIFFEASSVKSFASEAERAAFRERWLGRYLNAVPRYAYVAVDDLDRVQAYLVGSLDQPTADSNAFAGYPGLLSQFPAHLHVNVALNYRNQGVGGRLIDAFIADAKAAEVPGAHVVTAAQSDNVRFYERNGFFEAARLKASKPLVFLARRLA